MVGTAAATRPPRRSLRTIGSALIIGCFRVPRMPKEAIVSSVRKSGKHSVGQ